MPKKAQGFVLALAGGLLLIDAALLFVHLLSARLGASHLDPAWLHVHHWRVDADRGMAEVMQYLKFGLLLGGSLILYRRGNRGMLAFAALFAILLLDDWLQGHEQLGRFLAENVGLGSVAGLAPNDVGELIAWLLLGGIFLGLLLAAVVSARAARSPLPAGPAGGPGSTYSAGLTGSEGPAGSAGPAASTALRTIVTVSVLIVCLALFGVVIDAIAALVQGSSVRELGVVVLRQTPAFISRLASATTSLVPGILATTASLGELLTAEPIARALLDLRNDKVIWTLVEEGGEMVTVTLLVTYLWHQALPLAAGPRSEASPLITPPRRRSVL